MQFDIGDEVAVRDGGEEYETGTIMEIEADEDETRYLVWFYSGEQKWFLGRELEDA